MAPARDRAAGRLAEAKNYRCLIEAFAILRERTPASLFILGRAIRSLRCGLDFEPRSRRFGPSLRLSEKSLELHRARRRLCLDLALRRVWQRARRGDGVRGAGCRDQLIGHAGIVTTGAMGCSWPSRAGCRGKPLLLRCSVMRRAPPDG